MDYQDDIRALWDSAVAAYENETGRKLESNNVLREISTVDGLLNLIEHQDSAFSGWRTRHGKLTSRLTLCLKPVTVFGRIAQDALSNSPYGPPSSAIFGAVLHLIRAAEGVSEAYDWIERALGQLQDLPDRLNLYRQNDIDAVLAKKISAILTCLLKVIGRCETLITRGRFRHYLQIVFLVKDEKTKKILEEMNESLDKEQRYVVAATYASQKTTETGVKMLAQTTAETQRGIVSAVHLLEDSRDHEIAKDERLLVQRSLELPAADRTLELFEEFRSKFLKGTANWLCKEILFTAWTEQKIPILWIFGGPGSGKSFLATWTIEHLHTLYGEYQTDSSGVSVAYFYIRENEQQLRDANTILKTLAWQISECDPSFKRHAVNVCSSKKKIISAEQTWLNLFVSFYGSVTNTDKSTMLIIDGLDEAPKAVRSTLLSFFKGLLVETADRTRPRIQVAVIGRITLKGDVEFEREEKSIEVSRGKNQQDLDRYIEDRLSSLDIIRRLDDLDKLEAKKFPKKQSKSQASVARYKLKHKISSYADGVFLWAKLLLDQIHDKDYREIERVLSRPPSSLESMVKHVYERLSAEEEDLESIKKLLTWTAYAHRPLFFGEIDLILSLPSRTPNFLLWDKFQGKFASVFEMAVPDHTTSEEHEKSEEDKIINEQAHRDGESTMTPEDGNSGQDDLQAEENDTRHSGAYDDWDKSSEDSDNSDGQSDTGEFRLLDDVELDRGLDTLATGRISSLAGDYIHAYADWQLKTRITFSHLQFREFLVLKQGRDHIDLDINIERSHLEITLTCLDLLQCGYDTQTSSKYLIDYPSRFFARHLDLIDQNAIGEEDRYKIARGLCWLFHEDRGARSLFNAPISSDSELWDEYWTTWLATSTYTNSVRSWLAAAASLSQRFDQATLSWVQVASKSTKVLVEQWVLTLANMWLRKPSFDDKSYVDKSIQLVWLMHGLTSLDEHGDIDQSFKDFDFYQLDLRDLSPARTRELAGYALDESSPDWHTGLAWIYMQGYHNDEAICHFQRALVLHPNAWRPKEGLAIIYGDQKRWSEAIRLTEEAYSSLPKHLSHIGAYMLPRIYEWKKDNGDVEGACYAAYEAFELSPLNERAQDSYLKALDQSNYTARLIETLGFMKEQIHSDTQMSYLVRFLISGRQCFGEIGRAFRAEGRPKFVLEEMEKAITVGLALKDLVMKVWILGEIGLFRYQYNDETEEGMKLMEQAVKVYTNSGTKVQDQDRDIYDRYSLTLTRLYFDAAVSARNMGTNAWPYTKRLKQLATATNTTSEDFADFFAFYGTGYASTLWGCWLRKYEMATEDTWRKAFKARILEELNMLDDEDPSNDVASLHSLAITLLHLDDEVAAGALLAVLFMPLKALRESTAQLAEDSGKGEHESEDVQDHDKKHDDQDDECGFEKIKAGQPQSGAEVFSKDEAQIDSADQGQTPDAKDMEGAGPAVDEPRTNIQGNTGHPSPLVRHPIQHVEQTSVKSDSRLALSLDIAYIHQCDGWCSNDCHTYTSLFVCKICLGPKFCGECLQLVKEEKMVCRNCSPQHSWYQAWPIPEGKAELVAEQEGGKWIIRKEWLDALRAEWL